MSEKAKSCDHELHLAGPFPVIYFCQQTPGHDGLHRWSSDTGSERARVWFDSGTEIIDFFEGPYTDMDDPKSLTCDDMSTDDDGVFSCVRPKGHSGLHGNYHNEPGGPVLWTTGEDAKGDIYLYGDGPVPEGVVIPARFEIVIESGHMAVAKKVRLNGLELPNVHDLSVEYGPSNARTVIVEILATDILEVAE